MVYYTLGVYTGFMGPQRVTTPNQQSVLYSHHHPMSLSPPFIWCEIPAATLKAPL